MLLDGLGGDGGAGAEDAQQLVHLVVHAAQVGADEVGQHCQGLGLHVDAEAVDMGLYRLLQFPFGHRGRGKHHRFLGLAQRTLQLGALYLGAAAGYHQHRRRVGRQNVLGQAVEQVGAHALGLLDDDKLTVAHHGQAPGGVEDDVGGDPGSVDDVLVELAVGLGHDVLKGLYQLVDVVPFLAVQHIDVGKPGEGVGTFKLRFQCLKSGVDRHRNGG